MTLPRTPSFRLDGKRALVAGASSGLGRACATALAEAGAAVTLVARGAERLAEVAAEFRAEGREVETLALDIADVEATARAVAERGPFDVLLNSAGIARHGPAADTTPEDFDAVMAVNLRGSYFLAQAVAKGLIAAARPGSIITVTSQMGHVGGVDRGVYCASKFAAEGFTKVMAIEWGRHAIRVNTLAPTFIRTPLAEQSLAIPERRRWVEGMIKLGRIGAVEDIMGAAVYLASDASALVTGTSLLVDGGWTAD